MRKRRVSVSLSPVLEDFVIRLAKKARRSKAWALHALALKGREALAVEIIGVRKKN